MSITKEEALDTETIIAEADRLQLIYKYMEEAGWRIGYFGNRYHGLIENPPLDSNSAYECVCEMERKDHAEEFESFVNKNRYKVVSFAWLIKPTNFFSCMGSWLESKEYKKE